MEEIINKLKDLFAQIEKLEEEASEEFKITKDKKMLMVAITLSSMKQAGSMTLRGF